MRLFGLQITRAKAAPSGAMSVPGSGWWPLIREPYAGAWQRNESVTIETGLANSTVFRCVSLISSDLAKMRLKLVQLDENDIWSEIETPAFSPVLRKPNRYQSRIQFFETWMQSKLSRGNTYVLKQRDNRNVVSALYVLDPHRVKPLVAPDGAVYYDLQTDRLSGLGETVQVPASEIIHDRWNTFFHPLVGMSPLYAAGLSALQGLNIQRTSAKFFGNGARPGGILTAPSAISDETANRLKAAWDTNFTGDNVGKVAVLGDGLKYESMSVDPVDAQLVEQLKWSAETICSVFGVPAYMAGVGPTPAYNNIEALRLQYYSQCLQIHIEACELCLDEGMELPRGYGTEFDLDGLLRMDTATQVKTLVEAVGGGLMKPNEGRAKINLGPAKGGDQVFLQQQNFSLEALAKRDAKDDPFASAAKPAAKPAGKPPAGASAANDDAPTEAEAVKALLVIHKGLAHV